ncbi:LL-diaminopimelate aminotransferase [Jeotgalibacillus proteolyticus]|uniref:Aminotransferase n=1 Tax=Jeotgalibacillus proteolyticus TaxID=2082395 RepID=A0A2S5GFN8_9BACL|nr:LL-diaminopimelate aminotransferase [Jeotgalibacillus proteolyticus]PPA71850.1 LL-diaminopimelate aminotransferase [Jeotgalibacillus proteolyticus]
MEFTHARRMAGFKTLIFSELSAYKQLKISEGAEMIDLSIGSPDLAPPAFIRDSISSLSKQEDHYGYTLTGIKEFDEAVAVYYKKQHDLEIDPVSQVMLSMGSQDALVHLPMVFSNPGDYILVPDPGYTAYETGISMAEAVPYYMPLKRENGFLPDLSKIPDEAANKASIMILNFPGNPVPVQATLEFYEEAIRFAKKHHILIVHDFAYGELYYDGKRPISFLSVPGAIDVGVETNSLSKSFNMAGCRVGYLAGNAQVIQSVHQMKSNLDYGVFKPIQIAAAKALSEGDWYGEEARAVYQNRRDLFIQGAKSFGWDIPAPEGGMFVWAPVPEDMTSMNFCQLLMDEAHVVLTPGHAFGPSGEGYVRIALVQDAELLLKAAERIQKLELFKTPANQ